MIDGVMLGIIYRIRDHVLRVGLPPANTPVPHLIFFELIANQQFTIAVDRDPQAQREWERAGLSNVKWVGRGSIFGEV